MKDYLKNHHKNIPMKNNYYYLILPNKRVSFEAIEEVFREQEAYEKKFLNFSSRSGYVFSRSNMNMLPNVILKNITSSNFFKNLKMDSITSINSRTALSKDFTVFVSTNEEFITWVTLKIVEIESSKNLNENELINYDGFLSNLS